MMRSPETRGLLIVGLVLVAAGIGAAFCAMHYGINVTGHAATADGALRPVFDFRPAFAVWAPIAFVTFGAGVATVLRAMRWASDVDDELPARD
jgi:uncharacterized membrane-anchored protein